MCFLHETFKCFSKIRTLEFLIKIGLKKSQFFFNYFKITSKRVLNLGFTVDDFVNCITIGNNLGVLYVI